MLVKVDEYNAVRLKLTAEMADSANLVKAALPGRPAGREGGQRGGKFEQLICNVSKKLSLACTVCRPALLQVEFERQFYENEFQIKVETFIPAIAMKRKAAISAEALMSENANPGGGSQTGQVNKKKR